MGYFLRWRASIVPYVLIPPEVMSFVLESDPLPSQIHHHYVSLAWLQVNSPGDY